MKTQTPPPASPPEEFRWPFVSVDGRRPEDFPMPILKWLRSFFFRP